MPLSADWGTKLITVPKSELTLIIGTRYQITVDYWFRLLRELNGTAQGIVETINSALYSNTSPTTTTPRIVDVINGYTVVFEDGLYSVEFVDGNTNIREVEVKNTVSVGSNNTSALINPTVLEAGVFAGQVVVDSVDGVAGIGKTPTGEIIGTFRAPSNNMDDALEIALEQGIRQFLFNRSMTITKDLSAEYTLKGDSPFNVLTADPIADLTGCAIHNMSVQGEMDGLNVIRSCSILNITGASGFMEKCAFSGMIDIIGDMLIMESYQSSALVTPNLRVDAGNVTVQDFHGALSISHVTSGTHTIANDKGGLTIDASCTGGNIYVCGDPVLFNDNSGSGCTVFDFRGQKSIASAVWNHTQ